MWDQWSAEQCSGKCGCGSPLRPPPPLPLEPPQISPPWKKNLNPPSPPPLLFLFPTTLSHPISTTAPLPAPGFCCTNQEQMSAGAVLKDPAVLDASHMLFIQRWRLTARLLVKPISKKKRKKKRWKKTNSPNAFKCLQKPYIYSMSTPFCLHHHTRTTSATGFFFFLFFCYLWTYERREWKVMRCCWREDFLKEVLKYSSGTAQLYPAHTTEKLRRNDLSFKLVAAYWKKNKGSFRVTALRLHRYPRLRSKSNRSHSKWTRWIEDIPTCPAGKLSKRNILFEQDRQMRIFK